MLPISQSKKACLEHYRRGFTLTEVVVYVSLVAVLLVAVTASLIAMSKTSRELSAWRNLQAEGVSVMDRVAREIRVATSTDALSIFNTSPGRLVLHSTGLEGDVSGNTIITTDADDNLALKIGSAATTSLTVNTEVRSLTWRSITNGSIKAIRIELVLGTKPGLVDKTITFFNTIIMRSSYGN